MFTVKWVKDAAERAVTTFAEVLSGVLVVGVPVWDVDWSAGVGIAATATVFSVLKSIVATRSGDAESAALGG